MSEGEKSIDDHKRQDLIEAKHAAAQSVARRLDKFRVKTSLSEGMKWGRMKWGRVFIFGFYLDSC